MRTFPWRPLQAVFRQIPLPVDPKWKHFVQQGQKCLVKRQKGTSGAVLVCYAQKARGMRTANMARVAALVLQTTWKMNEMNNEVVM